MIPCYFDVQVREKPLRLIFDIHKELVEIYNKIITEQINNGCLEKFFSRFSHYWYFKKTETYYEPVEQTEAGEPEVIVKQRQSFNAGLYDEYLARNLFGEYFGLGETIVKLPDTKNFIRYEAPIPPAVFYIPDQVCPRCRGTKIDPNHEDLDWPCPHCSASGLATISNHSTVHTLADNLALLCRMIELLAYQKSARASLNTDRPLTCSVILLNDGYGQQLVGGAYTKELADYIKFLLDNKLSDDMAKRINQQMFGAYCLLTKGRIDCSVFNRLEFVTQFKDAPREKLGINFLMQVPGQNGCHIYNDDIGVVIPLCEDFKQISGITCHNVDCPSQQIPLLVGLATLNTAARQWLGDNNNN